MMSRTPASVASSIDMPETKPAVIIKSDGGPDALTAAFANLDAPWGVEASFLSMDELSRVRFHKINAVACVDLKPSAHKVVQDCTTDATVCADQPNPPRHGFASWEKRSSSSRIARIFGMDLSESKSWASQMFTSALARDEQTISPPSANTLASLLRLARSTAYGSVHLAARIPLILLAAMLMPTPVPQIKMTECASALLRNARQALAASAPGSPRLPSRGSL